MTRPVFQQAGEGKAANVTELSSIGIILFLYSVSFFGLFIVVIFRKSMITGNKLPYPSGTATAELINIFHVPQDAKLVLKQVRVLILSSFMSLMWSCFKWFLAAGNGCGFDYFPTFGLTAYKQRLYFNSSGAYVGLGMMSPYEISLSYLVGAFFS